jgi:hypothetical protein
MFDLIDALFYILLWTRRHTLALLLGFLVAYLVWQFTASLSIQAELAVLTYIVVFLGVVMTEKNDDLPR